MSIKEDAVRKSIDRCVIFCEYWAARFERNSEKHSIHDRQFESTQVKVFWQGGMWLRNKSSQWLFRTIQHGIYTDDGILRRQFFVGHVNGSIAMEHRLKTIDSLEPCEVLDISVRFRKIPGNDHAVWKFLHIVKAGGARLEEDANRRSAIDECAGRFAQRIKT